MYTKTLFLIAVTAFAAFAGIGFFKNTQPTSLVQMNMVTIFDQWNKEFKRDGYASPKEKLYRMGVFFKNLEEIEEFNKGDHGFKRGLNQFSDLTAEEFKAKYLGFRVSERVRNVEPVAQSLEANPTSVDWRTKGIVNPVKNQGQCGSCWAFSTIASLESKWKQDKGALLELSEQQLVDCSSSYGNHGCNGGLMDNAFKYIEAKGVTTEAKYPYKAKTETCKYSGDAAAHVTGYVDVSHNNGEALETAVAGQVVSIAVDAESWSSYSSGIYSKYCGSQLDHGVAIVGYGVSGSEQYWIVRNSWSGSWGEAGYIRVKKSTAKGKGECGINMMPSYPKV